ncbi:MAG: hypothetical protein IT376_22920 [Polyangiaceae bacterium]|nr:hypothetical protein [Polyangiaceae bacterium]
MLRRPASLALLAGAALAALPGPGCQPGAFGGLGATCPQLQANADPLSMSFSANARANGKIRAFVLAAKELSQVSLQMEAITADACARIAMDLGAGPPELAPRRDAPGERARAACAAASARMDWVLSQGISFRAQVTPPQCQANLQARARCEGACDVSVDPGQIVASCEPAKLSGTCSGRCIGRCDGQCNGACQGQCSQADATGRCVGQCNGTCDGGCSATCHARCEGQWQAPQCEGAVRPPSADAECNASCDASAEFNAQCTPAQVSVQASHQTELAARLVASLQANLPNLLYAQLALGKRLTASARVLVQVGGQLPRVVADAGLQGLACIGAAANATVKASARIDVSVQASASVSGRAGAG